jgi:hypothetical protein
MKRIVSAIALIVLSAPLCAQSPILELGTWVQRKEVGAPLSLTIEAVGAARKLTYHLRRPDGSIDRNFELVVLTRLDGSDAPVTSNGKPTGETMGIRRLDARHAITVLKMNGKPFGTSRAELSPDGKVLKVEDEITSAAGGQAIGKVIHYWDKR